MARVWKEAYYVIVVATDDGNTSKCKPDLWPRFPSATSFGVWDMAAIIAISHVST